LVRWEQILISIGKLLKPLGLDFVQIKAAIHLIDVRLLLRVKGGGGVGNLDSLDHLDRLTSGEDR
jgi:hypothetical protein